MVYMTKYVQSYSINHTTIKNQYLIFFNVLRVAWQPSLTSVTSRYYDNDIFAIKFISKCQSRNREKYLRE